MPSEPDAETLLATILEGIGLPFYAVDKDWRIYLYNGAAERHFGQPAEQMIGTTLWEHFPQDRDCRARPPAARRHGPARRRRRARRCR